MAAGKLQVEVVATTDKLDAGLDKSKQKVKETAKEMDKLGTGASGFTDRAVKFLAVLGAAETAMKGMAAAGEVTSGIFAGLNGDVDAMNESLDRATEKLFSLPMGIGPVVSAFSELADQFIGSERAAAAAAKAFEKMKEIQQLANSAEAYKAALVGGSEAIQNQLDLLNAADATERSILQAEQKREAALAALEEKRNAAIDSMGKELANRGQLNVEFEKQVELINKLADEEIFIARELKIQELARQGMAEQQAKAAALAKEQADAEREQAKIQKEKERELQKIERERLAQEKQKTAEIAKQAKLREDAERRVQAAQKEVAQARLDAEAAAAGATTSLSTAGGSFTIGVSAEVNEAKLANKISQGSQDILREILSVGMRLSAGGLA